MGTLLNIELGGDDPTQVSMGCWPRLPVYDN